MQARLVHGHGQPKLACGVHLDLHLLDNNSTCAASILLLWPPLHLHMHSTRIGDGGGGPLANVTCVFGCLLCSLARLETRLDSTLAK